MVLTIFYHSNKAMVYFVYLGVLDCLLVLIDRILKHIMTLLLNAYKVNEASDIYQGTMLNGCMPMYGQNCMVNGKKCMVNGKNVWSMVKNVWSMVKMYGQWSKMYGQWSKLYGQWGVCY